MKFWLLQIFLYFFISPATFSQVYSVTNYRKELNIKLSPASEKRLEKAVDQLNEASDIEERALAAFESMPEDELLEGVSKNYQKAIKLLIASSELYRNGHGTIHQVFYDNCEKFYAEMRKMNHYASGMQKAKYYRIKGKASYEHSDLLRNIVQESDKPGWIQYKMAEAFENERLAIRDYGRALQIYQDFPVEYQYGWVDDVTAEEVEEAFKDPNINRPPDDLFVQQENDELSDTLREPPVVFKVQIAAHTIQMTQDDLRSIYSGSRHVEESHIDQWYRYTIGEFGDYEEANSVLKESGVKRAFVVAYQEGERLTIKAALQKIRANQ